MVLFFFFSSRRRHTRCSRDWSSDVCSSDLGVVISLLLAVFYHLGLDRVLEPVRSQIAREGGLGTVVARTVAGRILGVHLAVAVSGFALITLFVLQAFQAMVADGAA